MLIYFFIAEQNGNDLTLLTSRSPAENYDDNGDENVDNNHEMSTDPSESESRFVDLTPCTDELQEDMDDVNSQSNGEHELGDATCKSDLELMPPPPPPTVGEDTEDVTANRHTDGKLVTPLAAMRPSKYADVDVAQLFPGFRPEKVSSFL